ncbi:Bifunctional protein GlmU [compost metagenome]
MNKYRTVIGDGVFVGSGTLMVAPVTLEEGATIGAGSVLTKTAPAGQLTVARAKQLTVPGWQRPQKLK